MRPIHGTLASACLASLLAACGGGGDEAPPAPTLSDRAPAAGAAEAIDAYVMMRFSEPMDAASLATGVSVSRVGGGAIAGAISASGDLAYFIPAAPFPAAAALQVSLSADVRSAAGARLGAPVSWSFTTAHWRPVSPDGSAVADGALFDPSTDGWAPIATAGSGAAVKKGAASVWTGSELVVWGGDESATGARFTP